MIRTQTIVGAINYNGVARLELRKEHYVSLPLPWWRKVYSLNWDEELWSRLTVMAYWYKANPFTSCWHIRLGWTYVALKNSCVRSPADRQDIA
jgi:hypothetical protein